MNLRAISETLVPPNANELDMTASSGTPRRATFGTKSRSQRGSGLSRCAVGGMLLEFALSVLALDSGNIPPTAHLDNPDPRCDLDFVPKVARLGVPLEAVMSNSFAFGGTNVSLVARKSKPAVG